MMAATTEHRPLVTFALFAYNQEKYIRDAVDGAFSQRYQPLEIILSDDCSSDRTFEIICELAEKYTGPHIIKARRNDTNLGLAAHINSVFQLAAGKIVVIAAGDDVSLPQRSDISMRLFNRHPSATAVLLSADIIDQNGDIFGRRLAAKGNNLEELQSLSDLANGTAVTFGATRAIKTDVFKKFGPLQQGCPTEDTPLLLRSLICGDNILSRETGALYRKHEHNLSNRNSLTKMNVSAIHEQYEADILLAQEKLLIDEVTINRLRKWIANDRIDRKAGQVLAGRVILAPGELIALLRSPAFPLRDKFKIAGKNALSYIAKRNE